MHGGAVKKPVFETGLGDFAEASLQGWGNDFGVNGHPRGSPSIGG
jgi:hypothetical protein